MKADKNYRMSKQLKTMLASKTEPHRRGEVKRAMIEAEIMALRFRNSRGRSALLKGSANES